jgi:hypothetical protein
MPWNKVFQKDGTPEENLQWRKNMATFHRIQFGQRTISSIDWEMNPDLSFGTYESWGGRERVRNNNEFVYYFFIDNWGEEPKLCLMERAVKHARVIAEIKAPPELVRRCVESQGLSSRFEQSYAINDQVRQWLIDNVLEGGDGSLVVPVEEKIDIEDMGPALPSRSAVDGPRNITLLPAVARDIRDEEAAGIVRHWKFYDADRNVRGRFDNLLVGVDDSRVAIDLRTSLMWQRGGFDISSHRMMQKRVDETNEPGLAGFNNWRLPTLEEAMSLMEPQLNGKGLHLHPCFSREQPFIFVAARRRPSGHWFVDYKQGRCFWSSATIPGGFGRLVRSLD